MSIKQTLSKDSHKKHWKISLAPPAAWTAILGFFFVILVGILAGVAPILCFVFPLGSFAVGVFLYRKYPILYVGFTWWLWFLAPLIKRLIDYRSGYGTFGNLNLSASLVTSISFVALWKYLINFSDRDKLPFLLCSGSVFYAFIIGLIRQTTPLDIRDILLSLMGWLGPIAFGFYLFINWRDYPSYRQNIQRIFFWATVVMGVYAIIQFFLVPSWDKFYIDNFGQDFSLGWFGEPEPMQLRVWSTMSSPYAFSQIWISGLILLLIKRSSFYFIITGLGYLVLLITRVRTSWYVWLLTFLFFTFSLKQGKQIRTIVSVATVLIMLLLLVSTTPFYTEIVERLATFFNLENDVSFQGRFQDTSDLMKYGLSNFLGVGLLGPSSEIIDENNFGNSIVVPFIDNGYLPLFLSLGWFGVIPFLSGLALIFLKLVQSCAGRFDIFFNAVRAIAIASFIGILTTNISVDEGAMNIWGFLGIALAGHKYHFYQRTAQQKRF